MTIQESESQIIDEFNWFNDDLEKQIHLIDLGKKLPSIDPSFKTDTYLISGCQSKVWLHASYQDGKVIFDADSNTEVVKGIISLLIRTLSNQSPDDILNANLDFLNKIHLSSFISSLRSNGLFSMIKQMKLYALVFKTKMAGKD